MSIIENNDMIGLRIMFRSKKNENFSNQVKYKYLYATRKCYDVSAVFTTNSFCIDFDNITDYNDAKKIFFNLPENFFELVEFKDKKKEIYFNSKKNLEITCFDKELWDMLESEGELNDLKFLDDV
jgi:hypothetical protein